jgi:hypothetical protein
VFRSELLVLFDIVNFARRRAHEISKCLGPAARSVKTRHACNNGEDSRRDCDPKSFTHVATPLHCVIPDSVPDAEKLGAEEARRMHDGSLSAARKSALTKSMSFGIGGPFQRERIITPLLPASAPIVTTPMARNRAKNVRFGCQFERELVLRPAAHGHGRVVTPPSQPCQIANPEAIRGCPELTAMEQLRPLFVSVRPSTAASF